MAFKYLGVKPPKVQHPTATELTEQLEHFRGALLETAELLKDYDTLKLELFDKKYPEFPESISVMNNLPKLLRVSAGETK